MRDGMPKILYRMLVRKRWEERNENREMKPFLNCSDNLQESIEFLSINIQTGLLTLSDDWNISERAHSFDTKYSPYFPLSSWLECE